MTLVKTGNTRYYEQTSTSDEELQQQRVISLLEQDLQGSTSTSCTACSFSLASELGSLCSDCSACSDTWKMFSRTLWRNETAILRCEMREVPGRRVIEKYHSNQYRRNPHD